jgi:hypothetical protein
MYVTHRELSRLRPPRAGVSLSTAVKGLVMGS